MTTINSSTKSAEQIISELADEAKAKYQGNITLAQAQAEIDSWYKSAGEAGDVAVVEAIEVLGKWNSATLYMAGV